MKPATIMWSSRNRSKMVLSVRQYRQLAVIVTFAAITLHAVTVAQAQNLATLASTTPKLVNGALAAAANLPSNCSTVKSLFESQGINGSDVPTQPITGKSSLDSFSQFIFTIFSWFFVRIRFGGLDGFGWVDRTGRLNILSCILFLDFAAILSRQFQNSVYSLSPRRRHSCVSMCAFLNVPCKYACVFPFQMKIDCMKRTHSALFSLLFLFAISSLPLHISRGVRYSVSFI